MTIITKEINLTVVIAKSRLENRLSKNTKKVPFKSDNFYVQSFILILGREVLFEFHLKFWNTASIGIPVRSLL